MMRGNAWKSPFLLSTLVFVAGMAATIGFSYFFFEKAEKDWNVRVDQTAERLSNTLLAWLEESYAPVSGTRGAHRKLHDCGAERIRQCL